VWRVPGAAAAMAMLVGVRLAEGSEGPAAGPSRQLRAAPVLGSRFEDSLQANQAGASYPHQ
jgi:hypothetical protein